MSGILLSLAPLAADLIRAPVSQAYIERIFPVCDWIKAGHHNRMNKYLEISVSQTDEDWMFGCVGLGSVEQFLVYSNDICIMI